MISYIGGKARIGKWIVPFIPNDIETYVEGFSGMFWVFFNMDLKKYPNLKTVVYNDFNRLNANLFKCAKHYDRLWEELSKYPCQQLGVEDTPPEYEQMFRAYQKEVFNNELVIGDTSDTQARVKKFVKRFDINENNPPIELQVSINTGKFYPGEVLVGTISSSRYIIQSYDTNSYNDSYDSNEEIQIAADSIIDFSESNPFGDY